MADETRKPEWYEIQQKFEVKFHASGRGAAQCPADPRFPNGIEVTLPPGTEGAPHCKASLPYPAPECGFYYVQCFVCGTTAAVTAAGRTDDPTSVELFCKTDIDEDQFQN